MCWSDIHKSKKIYPVVTQVPASPTTVSLPANVMRVGLIVTQQATTGGTRIMSGTYSGTPGAIAQPVLAFLTSTVQNMLMTVRDFGQLVTGPLTISFGANTGQGSVVELLLNEADQ